MTSQLTRILAFEHCSTTAIIKSPTANTKHWTRFHFNACVVRHIQYVCKYTENSERAGEKESHSTFWLTVQICDIFRLFLVLEGFFLLLTVIFYVLFVCSDSFTIKNSIYASFAWLRIRSFSFWSVSTSIFLIFSYIVEILQSLLLWVSFPIFTCSTIWRNSILTFSYFLSNTQNTNDSILDLMVENVLN